MGAVLMINFPDAPTEGQIWAGLSVYFMFRRGQWELAPVEPSLIGGADFAYGDLYRDIDLPQDYDRFELRITNFTPDTNAANPLLGIQPIIQAETSPPDTVGNYQFLMQYVYSGAPAATNYYRYNTATANNDVTSQIIMLNAVGGPFNSSASNSMAIVEIDNSCTDAQIAQCHFRSTVYYNHATTGHSLCMSMGQGSRQQVGRWKKVRVLCKGTPGVSLPVIRGTVALYGFN